MPPYLRTFASAHPPHPRTTAPMHPRTSAPLHPRTSAPLQEYRDFMSKSGGQKAGELNGTSELRAGHADSVAPPNGELSQEPLPPRITRRPSGGSGGSGRLAPLPTSGAAPTSTDGDSAEVPPRVAARALTLTLSLSLARTPTPTIVDYNSNTLTLTVTLTLTLALTPTLLTGCRGWRSRRSLQPRPARQSPASARRPPPRSDPQSARPRRPRRPRWARAGARARAGPGAGAGARAPRR